MNLIQKDPQGNFYQIGEDGRLTDITADEAGEFIIRDDVELFRWENDRFDDGFIQWHVKFEQ
jgi:hypothetical protein